MCAPAIVVAAMAISTASALVQAQEQRKVADAQTKMIEDGYVRDQMATQRQYAEQQQVSQEDLAQRHREQVIEEGRLQVIGAESGLSGVSNDRIQQEASNNADKDIATIQANRLRANEQSHTQGAAKQSQANTQLAGIRQPSTLGTGLQIAGSAASLYAFSKAPVNTPQGKQP